MICIPMGLPLEQFENGTDIAGRPKNLAKFLNCRAERYYLVMGD
jgi:hypothetical protein